MSKGLFLGGVIGEHRGLHDAAKIYKIGVGGSAIPVVNPSREAGARQRRRWIPFYALPISLHTSTTSSMGAATPKSFSTC